MPEFFAEQRVTPDPEAQGTDPVAEIIIFADVDASFLIDTEAEIGTPESLEDCSFDQQEPRWDTRHLEQSLRRVSRLFGQDIAEEMEWRGPPRVCRAYDIDIPNEKFEQSIVRERHIAVDEKYVICLVFLCEVQTHVARIRND